MSTLAKLESLLIKEVSGVDDPANEIPGWMVAKSSKFKTAFPIGPDESWDVGAAEKRVRAATKAEDGPNPEYASCFLWFDGEADDTDGDGVPDKFGAYKFLVVDEVDGKLQVMPQALRAAASRLSGSSLSEADKTSVEATLSKLESKAGIGDAAKAASATAEDAPNIVERMKSVLFAGKDVDMTKDELTAILDERDSGLVEKVAEAVAKSVAPAEGAPEAEAAAAAVAAEATAAAEVAKAAEGKEEGLTVETVTKAIEDAFAPYHEILEKALDRVENIENALAGVARKSLTGQEGEATVESTEGEKVVNKATVGGAIGLALRNPGKPVFLAGQSSGSAAGL